MSEEKDDVNVTSVSLKSVMLVASVVIVILGAGGTWYVSQWRIDELEKDLGKVNQRLAYLEEFTRKPRYGLDDDIRRMEEFESKFQRDLDRSRDWMKSHDDFRLTTVETLAQMVSTQREIKSMISDIRDEVRENRKERNTER